MRMDLRKKPYRDMLKEGRILSFPKKEGYTKESVEQFRKNELEYPKAWKLRHTKHNHLLVFDNDLFVKYYVFIPKSEAEDMLIR